MQRNRLGANTARNPAPRFPSGAPFTRLVTISIAVLATQDSSGFAAPMAVESVGRDCSTTHWYTPGPGAEASEAKMSERMDMKIGSRWYGVMRYHGIAFSAYIFTFIVLRPDSQHHLN